MTYSLFWKIPVKFHPNLRNNVLKTHLKVIFQNPILWPLLLFMCACWHLIEGLCVCSVASSESTLCNRVNCSPPGSSVHGTSQARILEQVAISFSRGSSQGRDRTHISHISCIAGRFFITEPWGKALIEDTSGFNN